MGVFILILGTRTSRDSLSGLASSLRSLLNMQFYITLFILFTHINHTWSPHNGSNPGSCPVMLMRAKDIGHVTRSSGKLFPPASENCMWG